MKQPAHVSGMKASKGLLATYRQINPEVVKESNGLKRGDVVKYKRHHGTVESAWGKVAGTITEIRRGRSGPLVISLGEMKHLGPKKDIALIRASDGTVHFSSTDALAKVGKR